MPPRLKTEFWIKSQIRLCNMSGIPLMVTHRGDPDSGTILLKLLRRDGRCVLLRQTTTHEGEQAWFYAINDISTSACDVPEVSADNYIEREFIRDCDLWVIEIEDYDVRYDLDGKIIT